MERFKAKLEPIPHGGQFVVFPAKIAAAAGLKYADRVRGTVNGAAYAVTVAALRASKR